MKRYYFVFCKDDLMLERQADGTYTIPLQEEPPTEIKPWTTILNITPLDDIEVKAYSIDMPPTSEDNSQTSPAPKLLQAALPALPKGWQVCRTTLLGP